MTFKQHPMIYIKEHNALFNSSEVKEPQVNYWGGLNQSDCDKIERDKAAYQQWLQSKIEVVGEHTFQENVEYEKDVHFVIRPCCDVCCDGTCKNYTPKLVAIPIKEDEEKET